MLGREGVSDDDEKERRIPTGMRVIAALLVLDAMVWRIGRRIQRRKEGEK